ncbi:SDR family oxidoreductase N-terminal domain protein [Candidatus Cyrtobacter comes]|uniref:SDR family oxidoreductase N-terminal domain protein n=1 Tax=Candidatus Cyrtobacter comes TaxID=675776 RepID=A0ABU5L9Q0_9RICK|nr:SDR family NAD(P)-dependent oxidoreductase [Candidatus Cyrtobacter comes]MDZ5762772.1 SDR family oxidoreductase N-terminal domain protein [Candidatus Cyrtobacter comes]
MIANLSFIKCYVGRSFRYGRNAKKVWFVTGCSKSFGRSIVEELLKNSNHVATARNTSTLDDLQEQYGDRTLVLKLDVTNTVDTNNSINRSVEKFHRIDVLVNGTLEEAPMQDIRDIFDTNVFGLISVTKAALPIMREQQLTI